MALDKQGVRTPCITAIGMATLDDLYVLDRYPEADTEEKVVQHAVAVGGAAGRGAVTAARLGGSATLLSMSGVGIHAARLRAELADSGVSFPLVTAAAPSQHSCVLVVPAGSSRATVWIPPAPASQRLLESLAESIRISDAVLVDLTDPALAERAIAECRTWHVPVVVDSGSYKRWSEDLLYGVDHIIAPGKYFAVRSPGASLSSSMVRVFDRFEPKTLAATRGADGVLILDAEGFTTLPATDVVAVDTCGAGDVFHGAFTWALANALPFKRCFEIANMVAGMKCMSLGNVGITAAGEAVARRFR